MSKPKQAVFDQPGALMKKATKLVQDADLVSLSAETTISFYWLKKFARGTFKNPSVNRVEFLYEHLSKKKLKV